MSTDLRFRDTGPTFGQMVRALRMGFYWLHQHGCFMRLSGKGPFRCELYPNGLIPNSAKSSETYTVFWPYPENGKMNPGVDVEQIEAIKNIVKIKRPVSFYFDENGKSL